MAIFSTVRVRHSRRVPHRQRFCLEPLESRSVPSTTTFTDHEPDDTADLAQALGSITSARSAVVEGTLGNSAAGAADVDWLSFTLDEAAAVTIISRDVPTVLGLYARVPFDFFDRFAQTGRRLLTQTQSSADGADNTLSRRLAPGSYDIAVSGAGNADFHPFLAGSGYNGATGAYRLSISAQSLQLDPAASPILLCADPGDGGAVDRSPMVLRLSFSGALNGDSALPGDSVLLTSNPQGTFGDGNDQDVWLDQANFSAAANELQLVPAAPLAPGFYQITLAGDTFLHFDVVTDANGMPLGSDEAHPFGQDVVVRFQVTATEEAGDTPVAAHELGDLTGVGLVQRTGAIGDDPFAPAPFDPSDVDLYHFEVTGSGHYALSAEVFARRLGSPLNSGVSLFRRGNDGLLHLVTGNDDTRNDIAASNGRSLPLFSDSALFTGIEAGDYYLAVSSRGNVPDPDRGALPGQDGIFDPNVAYSGTSGTSTGTYALNVLVQPDHVPPRVISVTPGPVPAPPLTDAPTHITVQFSEPVDLRQLAVRAYEQTAQTALAPVFVEAADGTHYFPRLESYDDASNRAVFQLLDRLPRGGYTLHLSGALGLTDFAGNPLVGTNDGDFTSTFSVLAPPVALQPREPNDDLAHPQDLGPLFPHELQQGVVIERSASAGSDSADFYQIDLLQDQTYFFLLTSAHELSVTLYDASGNIVPTAPQAEGGQLGLLTAGRYIVEVAGWADASQSAYQLRINLGGSGENPPPLTLGPAPVIRLRLAALPAPATTDPSPGLVFASAVTPAPAPPAVTPVASSLSSPFQALATGPIGTVRPATPLSVAVRPERLDIPALAVAPGPPSLSLVALTPPPAGVVPAFFTPAVAGPGQAPLTSPVAPGPGPMFPASWWNALDHLFNIFDALQESAEDPQLRRVNAEAPVEQVVPPEDGECSWLPPLGALSTALVLPRFTAPAARARQALALPRGGRRS